MILPLVFFTLTCLVAIPFALSLWFHWLWPWLSLGLAVISSAFTVLGIYFYNTVDEKEWHEQNDNQATTEQ